MYTNSIRFNTENFPAIFNPTKGEEVSAKYQFVNTAEVIQVLNDSGFKTRQVTQRGSGPASKHMVRLTSDIQLGNGNLLEVVLRNSHNGTSSLNLQLGVFRLICSNGLVVCDQQLQALRLRHMGEGIQAEVNEALMQISEQRRIVAEQIQLMEDVRLHDDQVIEMAKQALVIAFPDDTERHTDYNAKIIRLPRRTADHNNTVWQAYNSIQENLIRGGMRLEGMNRRTTMVKDLDRDFSINQGLWNLGVQTAKAA